MSKIITVKTTTDFLEIGDNFQFGKQFEVWVLTGINKKENLLSFYQKGNRNRKYTNYFVGDYRNIYKQVSKEQSILEKIKYLDTKYKNRKQGI